MKNLVALVLVSILSFHSFAQDSFYENIVVEGKSSVKLVPELITFSINLSVRDTNYANCMDLATKEIERVKSEFTKKDIDQKLIQTVNYSIREEQEHDPVLRRQVFKGYLASIPIIIKTQLDYSKNDLIFEIIKNSFKANFNLNFSLSPKQIESVKEKLIEMAVKDARTKAKQLAKSADIKLGRVCKIQYGEPQTIGNFMQSNFELRSSSVQAMSSSYKMNIESLNPVEIEMQTDVMVAWKIAY